MGTLCNACGINYRRALAKSQGETLNLDRLAEQMGHTRLSIQKALKRQRKLTASAQLAVKRARVTPSSTSYPTAISNLTSQPTTQQPLESRYQTDAPTHPRTYPVASHKPNLVAALPQQTTQPQDTNMRLPPFQTLVGHIERSTRL